jgi:hypothetical protein
VELAWDSRLSGLDFQLRCRDRHACHSFLVQAHASPPEAFAWQDRLQHMNSSGLSHSAGAAANKSHVRAPLLAKAGETAILTMQSGSIRIRLQVVCLQRGALGQIIRARDMQSKKVYRGEVVSPRALRAVVD